MTSYDFHRISSASYAFLIDTIDLAAVEGRLAKHSLAIKIKTESIFSNFGSISECVVDGKQEDIAFALDDCVKLLRPYPKIKK